MSSLPPLAATVTRRDGALVLTVGGVEIGSAPDLVAATNRLCSEAAKYRRHVFVEVRAGKGVQHLEIDEHGTVTRTAGAANLDVIAARRPATESGPSLTGGPRQQPVPAALRTGHASVPGAVSPLSGAVAAHVGADGGYPAAVHVSGGPAGTAPSGARWRLRRHRRTVVRSALVVALCVGGAAVSALNVSVADASRTQADTLAAVPHTSPRAAAELRDRLTVPAPAALTALRQQAHAAGVQLRPGKATTTSADWATPFGPVRGTRTRVEVHLTAPDPARVAPFVRSLTRGPVVTVLAVASGPDGVDLSLELSSVRPAS